MIQSKIEETQKKQIQFFVTFELKAKLKQF